MSAVFTQQMGGAGGGVRQNWSICMHTETRGWIQCLKKGGRHREIHCKCTCIVIKKGDPLCLPQDPPMAGTILFEDLFSGQKYSNITVEL